MSVIRRVHCKLAPLHFFAKGSGVGPLILMCSWLHYWLSLDTWKCWLYDDGHIFLSSSCIVGSGVVVICIGQRDQTLGRSLLWSPASIVARKHCHNHIEEVKHSPWSGVGGELCGEWGGEEESNVRKRGMSNRGKMNWERKKQMRGEGEVSKRGKEGGDRERKNRGERGRQKEKRKKY